MEGGAAFLYGRELASGRLLVGSWHGVGWPIKSWESHVMVKPIGAQSLSLLALKMGHRELVW